jgi:hypothetical protein
MSNESMMQPDEEEKVFGEIIGKLKQLKNVDAPNNFEDKLFRKINSENYVLQNERPQSIFIRKKLVPSLAVVAVAIIVTFMIITQPSRPEDPFSIKPRIREDVIASGENINRSVEDLVKKGFKENSTDQKPSPELKMPGETESELEEANKDNSTNAFLQGNIILSKSEIKNGLNFKQVYLDKSQRKEVAVLKEKMEKMYYESKR